MWGSRPTGSPNVVTPARPLGRQPGPVGPAGGRPPPPRRACPVRPARRPRHRSPTAATTFSSPARRARSCSPPTMNGSSRSPRRTMSAPMPAGPPSLCEETDTRSASDPVEVDRDMPGGGDRVDVGADAETAAVLDDLGHRLEGAHLVVGPLAVEERRGSCRAAPRSARSASATASTSIRPQAVDGDGHDRPRSLGGVPNRRVLDRRAGHRSGVVPGGAPHGGVDGLGSSRGEHHLTGPDRQEPGHLLPRLFQLRPGPSGPRCGHVPDRR